MENLFRDYVQSTDFPCIMAKSVLNQGYLSFNQVQGIETAEETKRILQLFYPFIDQYRMNAKKLSSFVLNLTDPRYLNFDFFETRFWIFLREMSRLDKKNYSHDSRVSSDPNSPSYCYSVKEEGFFILALHPESPRLARRFKTPTIVFNPHQQFENLRSKGLFKKVRDLIRSKDKLLQGFINPMLADFGEKSEVFQYLGKIYPLEAVCPLQLG